VMRLLAIVVIVLSFLLTGPVGAQAPESSYVGKVYPPLPAGCVDEGARTGPTRATGHDLEIHEVNCATAKMLWLAEFIALNPSDQPEGWRWRATDVVSLPLLPAGYELFDHTVCYKIDDPRVYILAIGRRVSEKPVRGYHSGWHVADITHAWAANSETAHFETISPKKVKCGISEADILGNY